MNRPKLWSTFTEAAAEFSLPVDDLLRELLRAGDFPKRGVGRGKTGALEGRSVLHLPTLREWAKGKGLLR